MGGSMISKNCNVKVGGSYFNPLIQFVGVSHMQNQETPSDTIPMPPTKSDIISDKLRDMETPGFEAEFDPDEAEALGAFPEDALSEEDARESSTD